tara:strand:+ start:471 stop:647 length:177 start_codon:yes stop_codon:yes gene_type:complete
MKRNDNDLTRDELINAIEQIQRIKNNNVVWSRLSKHMKGAFIYRLGKFQRLLEEKNNG